MTGTVCVLPSGRVAVGRSDGIIEIWGSQSRSLLGQLHGHSGEVEALDVLPDGTVIAANHDGELVWMNRRDGTVVERQERWLEFDDLR